jgi:hypothetical protein
MCTYTLLEPVGRPRPPIPSRCSPFPPRKQLLAVAVQGAVVVVVAIVIVVVVVVALIGSWHRISSELTHTHS